MAGHTQIAKSPQELFMQTVRKELAAFEKRELEFQAEQRKERAAKLKLPSEKTPSKSAPH